MLEAVDWTDPIGPTRNGSAATPDSRQLLDWLRSGRLTLVDSSRAPLPPDAWEDLPAHVKARAVEDFRRLVTANAKAAVIFLRP
jgi:hypothetical protein